MTLSRPSVEQFKTSNGALIFRIPVEVFPDYVAYCHLISLDGKYVLVDTGSGLGRSHEDLVHGLAALDDMFGLNVTFAEIQHIIITHGHIDHFGGVGQIKEMAPQAKIGLHELARPVLVSYHERVTETSQRMRMFLDRAGVGDERRKKLLEMYALGKTSFHSTAVDFAFRDNDLFLDAIRVIHVPGHEAGLIMLQIGDILLTADHVLPATNVALAPESLLPYTGAAHYLESLEKAEKVPGVGVALGGHEWPMPDYYQTVNRSRLASIEKIDRVLAETAQPRTVYEIALAIYGPMDGYGELLKINQTGARIEYLSQRGLVSVDNLEALEKEPNTAVRYQRT